MSDRVKVRKPHPVAVLCERGRCNFVRLILPGVLFASVVSACAAEFDLNGHKLTVPDGFHVELVAGPPMVDRPIAVDFDERGRLYVTDSSGSNDKVEKQLAEKPHRILRLEDTDGDGRYDQRVVFADKMMFPEGVMWLDGSVYVAAPPSIWKLTDTDDDGVADQREEWFKGGTLTGCANDLHGPYAGPDGWIYWCKGAFAEQKHNVRGKPFVSRASHVFRARPDGSGLEPIMTGGMDNPVDVAFTREGEPILTNTFFQHPAAGHRDGLIHVIHGGLYGKSHDVLDGHVRTGELMPVLTHLGPAAPSGLTNYRPLPGGGSTEENHFYTALFNLHKITRHKLVPAGSTFRTEDEDFLVAADTDFHPTDVVEDADGSLLVVDTGGWYKLCCPTSQLHKPDVLGGIYRVRRKGDHKVSDPRGSMLAWERFSPAELLLALDDPRFAVRDRAIRALARRGSEVVSTLEQGLRGGSEELRRNALWALTRIDAPAARAAIRGALADSDPSVRHVAARGVSLWRDRDATTQLEGLLQTGSPALQRVAAEALGRVAAAESVSTLLGAVSEDDRALEHAIIFALIEVGDVAALEKGMIAGPSASRKAAFIALDQIPGKHLTAEAAIRFLEAPEPSLQNAATAIVGRHPEWSAALTPRLSAWLNEADARSGTESQRETVLGALAQHQTVQELLAATVAKTETPPSQRLMALRAMARARLKNLPEVWMTALAPILQSDNASLVEAGVAAVRSQPAAKDAGAEIRRMLLGVLQQQKFSPELRLSALTALPAGGTAVDDPVFDFVIAQLARHAAMARRRSAASGLAKVTPTRQQQQRVVGRLKEIAPTEFGQALMIFEKSSDEQLGLDLVGALKQLDSASLVPGVIKPRLAKFPERVQKALDELLEATAGAHPKEERAHLDEVAVHLPKGDIHRGQAIFNSPNTACVLCHTFGYGGGNFGPDLTRVGGIRTPRDLLEAIVYPSASFVRSYEPTVVTTTTGEVHQGMLRGENESEVTLSTGPGAELRIARGEIKELQPGTASLMPQIFEQVLTPEELADLVAFLAAAK